MGNGIILLAHFKNKKNALGLGLSCLLFVLVLSQTSYLSYIQSFLNRINGILYDTILKFQTPPPKLPRVAVVDIDDYSAQLEGRWPWPRDKFATLILKLKKAGAVVIACDIVFSTADTNQAGVLKERILHSPRLSSFTHALPLLEQLAPKVDNDEFMAQALKNNDVVLGFLLHNAAEKKGMLPAPLNRDAVFPSLPHFTGYSGILPLFLQASPYAGFVSNIPDTDGIVRHGLTLAIFNHQLYPSLALATVMRYWMADKITIKTYSSNGQKRLSGLMVENIFIPTNSQGQILIPFFGPPKSLPYYSAADVLHDKLPSNELAGAVVIVGSTTVLLGDNHPAPLAQAFPGVEMNANVIAAMLSQNVPREYHWKQVSGATLITLLGILLAWVFPFLNPIPLLIVFSFLVTLILVTCFEIFAQFNIFFPPTILLLLVFLQGLINFFYAFMLERRQKNKIKDLFGQYVPPSYVKLLTDTQEQYTMEGETREMSVFFSDIRDFTQVSEMLEAKEVKHLLNALFTPMTEIIFKHQGTIDKYVGDMLVAFWGAPIYDKKHAYHCILAALEIKKELCQINLKLESMHLPTVNIGMGINSGLMNVGDMGSKFRRAYTVIGDAVNLASRLESLTKVYGASILVSEATRIGQEDFLWHFIDKVIVKGRKEALIIYEPLGFKKDMSVGQIADVQEFEQALNAYQEQDWTSAQISLERLIKRSPNKVLYQLYLERIEIFREHPPQENWDGVFVHTQK